MSTEQLIAYAIVFAITLSIAYLLIPIGHPLLWAAGLTGLYALSTTPTDCGGR